MRKKVKEKGWGGEGEGVGKETVSSFSLAVWAAM